MEWSIQDVAKVAGTTSRTLRHYDDEGLLKPSRVGTNGYRYYDQSALSRLQRILLLRELGLGLPAIAEALASQEGVVPALATHVELLEQELTRINRQIKSIERTQIALNQGGELTMNEMFDGFDHSQYRDEVERRWGNEAYATSASWWESKSALEQSEFKKRVTQLNSDWIALVQRDADPVGPEAQEVALRHVEWLTTVPGTPASDGRDPGAKNYIRNLTQMYVADERFAANYGGTEGAQFVRVALEYFVEANM